MKRCICFLGLLVLAYSVHGQSNDSQILMAKNAKLIVVGEIEFIDMQPRFQGFTTVGGASQVVVFRIVKVLFGSYGEKQLRVDYQIAFDKVLPKYKYDLGKKIVLLIEREKSSTACSPEEMVFNDKGLKEIRVPEYFRKYLTSPCYVGSDGMSIVATKEELTAVDWIVSNKQ